MPENVEPDQRITDYLPGIFPLLPTKSSVKKAIKKRLISANDQVCESALFIVAGQIITFYPEINKQKVFECKLEVIFEDEHIALINKPAGFPVSGNAFKTIQNALPFNLNISNEEDALAFPLPVHRLDAQTSGLLLIAKTQMARINLGNQFEKKEVKKKYQALVIGLTPVDGNMEFPVDGKEAQSEFYLLKVEPSLKFEYLSLLELIPVTGRTHQLRIHCKESGFPILGDKLYFNEGKQLKGKGLFLCSVFISFEHPKTNEKLSFQIPHPDKFDAYMMHEKKRYIMNLNKV